MSRPGGDQHPAPERKRRDRGATDAGPRGAAATPRSSRHRRGTDRTRFWLIGLTALAFLFRLAHVLASRGNPFFSSLPVDCAAYDRWAQRIAGGEWIGHGVFYQDPLYPYLLGIFYRIFGRHLTALLLLQSLFGSANVLLLWGIARRLWNREVAMVTAVLAALYAPFWFYDGLVLKTFLEVLLLDAGLLALLRAVETIPVAGARRWGLATGVILGLGSLARANYLALIPLLLFWLWLTDADRPRKRVSLSTRHAAVGLTLLAGLALVLLPVLLRNRAAGGDWVLTTSQGGQNFYIGNNAGNSRGVYAAPSFVRPDPQHEQEDFLREAERRTGLTLSPSQASRFWMGQGLAFMARDPGHALALDLRKLGLFLHRYEEPDNEDISFWGRYSPWLRFNFLRFGIIAPLALVGLIVAWPLRRRLALLYLVLGGYTLSVCLFFILARYRLPAVSLLLIFAAGALVETRAAWQRGERRRVGLAAALLLPALLVVHRPNAEESGPMSPEMYTNLGMAYLEQGRVAEAVAANREAVRLAPQFADARYNLGIALYKNGDADGALAEFHEVVRLNPDFAEGWSYLGNLFEERNNLAEAEADLRRAATLKPEAVNLFNLARVLGEEHRKDETTATLRQLYALHDPQYSVDGRLIEAKLLAETGDLHGAAAVVRDYLGQRPDSPMRPQLEASLKAWEK